MAAQRSTGAKKEARGATRPNQHPSGNTYLASSTIFNNAVKTISTTRPIPERIGRYSKEVDTALPGRHTRIIYDNLNRNDARILVQLRTGMIRLNSYLFKIKAADTDICPCGITSETPKHFLFRCSLWTQYRTDLYQQTSNQQGNLFFFVGGKGRTDPAEWEPNLAAIHATIKFVKATGRLQQEPDSSPTSN